jgi:hypothetical protein
LDGEVLEVDLNLPQSFPVLSDRKMDQRVSIGRIDRKIEYKKDSSEGAKGLPAHPSSQSLLVETGLEEQTGIQ